MLPLGEPLGAFLGHLRGLLGRLEAVLGVLGRSWTVSGPFWAAFGASWGQLGSAGMMGLPKPGTMCPAPPPSLSKNNVK